LWRERNWKNITRESSSDPIRRTSSQLLAFSCNLLPAGLQTSPNNASFLSCGWRSNRGVRVCCRNAGLKALEPVGGSQTRSVDPIQHVNAQRFPGITCRDRGRDPLFQVRFVGDMLCDDKTLPPLMHRGQ
jgi:hypothetical protein